MKKIILLILNFLVFMNFSYSQITYHVVFGGSEEEMSSNILATKDNGCILVGKTKTYCQGESDILVTKLNDLGTIQWCKHFGTSSRNVVRDIIEDSQNGYIITGWIRTSNSGFPDNWYIINIDTLGNIIWEKFVGSDDDDEVESITKFENNYFLSGNTMCYGQGLSDFYISRMDESGNFFWFKTIGGNDNEYNKSIKVTSDNNLIIAGFTNSFGSGNYDLVLTKLNFNGTHLWSKTYGGSSSDYIQDVVETSDNGFLVLGHTNGFGAGNFDILLLKTDNSGNLIWSSTYGGSNDDRSYKMKKTNDGGIIISGYSNSFGAGGYDVYLLKVHEDGNLIWAKSFGGESDEYQAYVDIASDGGYIINSTTKSFGSDDADLLVIKTDEEGNSCCGEDVSTTIVSEVSLTEILINPTIGTGSNFPQHNTNNSYIEPNFRDLCFEPIEIFGKDTVCFGEENVLYSILPNIEGNFNWTVPQDATIVSGQGYPSIIVDFGQISGYIYASLLDGCNPDNLDSLFVNVLQLTSIDIGNDTTICSGDSLILNAGSGYETYLWQDDSSDSIFIAYESGLYWVEVTNSNGCIAADSILLSVIPVQNVFLGNDTTICIGSFLELNAGSGFDTYLWQDGTTDSVYLATQSGNYWVEVSDICGVSSDTINVTFAPGFYINLGNDTTFCAGDSLILNAGSGYETYLWQDSSLDSIFIAYDSGLYWVEVTDSNGCIAADSISLTVLPVQNVFLGNDTTICIGSFLELNAGSGFDTYLWQDGSTDSVFSVYQSGNYWVEVSEICGVSSDTINVTFAPGFYINLGNDTTFCAGDSIILNAGSGYETYLWQDDSFDSIFIVYDSGLYWVEVADSNGCIAIDSISLTVLPAQNVFLGNDTTICIGSFLELNAGSGFDTYLWQDGTTDSVYLATQSGNYWVEVSDICGVSSDTINVTFFPDIYIDLGNDTSFCFGNSLLLSPGSGFVNYLWQNGSSDSIFIAGNTAYYWVEVTDTNGCTAIDSVFITVFLEFEISIGNDTSTICDGDYLFLDPGSGFESYLWQDNSTYQTFIADTTGIYWVEVTNINSCSARDSILLIVNKIPENFLGNDTIICPEDIVPINAGGDFIQYLWQDGSSDSVFFADSIGTYWVDVEDEIGCSGSDTIVLFPFIPPSLNLQDEVFICKGDSVTFNASSDYSFYLWQDGSNDSVFRAYDEGLYWINILTDCGFYSDSVLLSFYENAYLNLGNDTIICKDETIKLNAGNGFSEYLWQDGSEENDFYVTEAGTFWVDVFDGNCYVSDTIFVDECSSLWVPNIFTPNGDNYNDYFYAVGNKITKFRMEIFNRWGRKLKTLNNIDEKWDGKYKGNKCPQGVYFWIADFEIYDKGDNIINKIMNGSVTLKR
jgi:gliding motility-associated-like protein